MVNKKKLLLCFTIVIILNNYSSLYSKEQLKPNTVPKEAVWFEKRKLWALEKENGITTFWYQNGNKAAYFQVINDKLNGLFIKWYENGNKRVEGTYKDDLLIGLWKYWRENGTLEAKGSYIDDKEHGLWELYDENGQKKAEVIYKDGVKISERNFTKEKK